MSDTASDHEDTETVQSGSPISGRDSSPEYQAPISAVPPRVVLQEESQVEVSASPAFQCLDELFQQGDLTGTRVAVLKAKYTELHEFLKSTRDSEQHLLQQAKQFYVQLDEQKNELDKADNFPESSNTEVTKMRQKFLKHNNDLTQAEERQYELEYKIECLQEEKKLIDREYNRMPKQGEMEKKIKELQQTCDDLKKEIAQRQLECKNFREDLEVRMRQYQQDNKEYEQEVFRMETLKGDLVAVNSLPNQIGKECDKMGRKKDEVDKKRKEHDVHYEELTLHLKQLETKRQKLEEEKFVMDAELDGKRAQLEAKERQFDALHKEHEYTKDAESELMTDRAELEVQLRAIQLEKKNQHELHSRKQRERDKDIKSLKKAELMLKVAEDNLNHTRSIYEKVKSQSDAYPKDDGTLLHKRQDLTKEVEAAKRQLAQENSLTAVEQVKVEQSIASEERLLYEQSDLRIEVVELTRLAAIKADEREQKARDFMRAEMRYHRAVEDLKSKQLQIQDNHKKHQEMQQKLKEFAKLYDVKKKKVPTATLR